MEENYYRILGISQDASIEEIKKTYRGLARKYHPDINKDSNAEEIFKKITVAYKTLSDPQKRHDYDETLDKVSFNSKQSDSTSSEIEEETSKFNLFFAAFFRILITILATALLGIFINFLAWYLTGPRGFNLNLFWPGALFGALAGLIWGIDINFDINSFLGPGLRGKIYSFTRTIIASLSIGYFGGLFGFLLDNFIYKKPYFLTTLGFLLGVLLGATFGSDGETVFKLKSKKGRFNIIYTSLRGILIGFFSGLVAFLSAFILLKIAEMNFFKPAIIFGFIIGTIIGASNPGNLAAYASYTSASLKNVMIFILIIAALVVGIIIGIIIKNPVLSIIYF